MVRDRRRHLPVPMPVELRRPNGSWGSEYAVNLSAGGLCLHLREPLPVGARVRVAFELPSGGCKVEGSARVVWVTCERERGSSTRFCEMGLAFDRLEGEGREELRRYAMARLERVPKGRLTRR